MDIHFLSFAFYNLLFLVFIYIAGHFFLSIFKIDIKEKHGSVFIKLLTGTLFIIGIYSIIKTGFSTIQTGFIVSSLLLFWNRGFKKSSIPATTSLLKKDQIISELGIIIQLYVVGILILTLNYFFLQSGGNGIPQNPHCDMNYYSNISSFLNNVGIETFEMNYLEPGNVGNSPYHYFELWTTAFFSFTFHCPSTLIVNLLITLPILIMIIIAGIWAIMEQFKINLFYKIFSLFLILINGMYFSIYVHIHLFWTAQFQSSILDQSIGLKTSPMYIGIILFIFLIGKNKYVESIMCLLFFPFISVYAFTTFIPVAIGMSIYFFIAKKIDKTQLIKLLISIAVVLGYYKLFYAFTSNSKFYGDMIDINTIIPQLFQLPIKSRIINIVEKLIESILVYIPFIALLPILYFNLKKNKPKYTEFLVMSFWALISFYFFAMAAWHLFFYIFSSNQLLYVVAASAMNIFYFFVIYFILINTEKNIFSVVIIIYVSIIAVALFSTLYINNKNCSNYFSKTYSDTYFHKINTIKEPLKKGAMLLTPDQIYNNFTNNPFYYGSSLYLNYIRPGYQLTSFSVYSIPGGEKEIDKLCQNNFLRGSPFIQFINEKKNKGDFRSMVQSQLDYIDKYHLTFIVISKDVEPDSLIRTRMKEEIKDSLSGEKFWILK